jgi:hypothetical protein
VARGHAASRGAVCRAERFAEADRDDDVAVDEIQDVLATPGRVAFMAVVMVIRRIRFSSLVLQR